MRTGIAVLVLPMSVISVLIATSKYYDITHILYLLVPLGILNIALLIIGPYFIIRSISRMRKYDKHIQQIKLKYSAISEIIE
jgi:Kef-type K+ transport system membrane component KefB